MWVTEASGGRKCDANDISIHLAAIAEDIMSTMTAVYYTEVRVIYLNLQEVLQFSL